MTYNFDEIISRESTSCIKWDARQTVFGNPNVLPMWVADMDFKSPDFVVNALRERLTHEVLGYTYRPESYFDAIIRWVERRNGWVIEKEWICHSPGVVPGLNVAVWAYTQPQDRIVIQTPVYPPFFDAILKNNRTLIENPLIANGDRFEIDFENLDTQLQGAKAIILSNPHNPTGRVFDEKELLRIGELCEKHNVTIISDEIHSDIIMKPHRHRHIAAIANSRFANRCVTFMAPSKTFNLAGLSTAYAAIPNPELRKQYLQVSEQQLHLGMSNLPGLIGLEAAYTHGDEWLDQLNSYILGNIELLDALVKEHLPRIKVYKPEGTYLAWMDFGALGLTDEELDRKLIGEAKVGLNKGITFGANGKGFRRINLACPRAYVQEAVERMRRVL
ncbi:MalY/PatB family protein [Alistipes sp. ZOR0009]|uniref:MalY/PatB family protein n=1 Tax=Alistipes sp. ZOR0009 TaxID=1339253 RepID=UPI000646A4B2|nr:MalY/PatB family protein [Alistipes sp. ZOR0009]